MYPVAHMTFAVGATWAGARLWRRLTGREPRIDYRIVALGSLVPDAIDKPLARWGPDEFADGHLFGHTLLFSVVLIALGLLLCRLDETRLLWLAFGCLSHLFVDPTIAHPHLMFWPLDGWTFEYSNGLPGWWLRGFDALLVVVALAVLAKKTHLRGWVRRFASTGQVKREATSA